jgi:transcription elongation factor Elf1
MSLSEDLRLPFACPSCGSHLMRVSQVKNPDDKVHCASCHRFICLYHEAETALEHGPSSETEALIEKVTNRKDKG